MVDMVHFNSSENQSKAQLRKKEVIIELTEIFFHEDMELS